MTKIHSFFLSFYLCHEFTASHNFSGSFGQRYKGLIVNPLSLDSDENEISVYSITSCSNIQVMRIKEVNTKDKMS